MVALISANPWILTAVLAYLGETGYPVSKIAQEKKKYIIQYVHLYYKLVIASRFKNTKRKTEIHLKSIFTIALKI
jgi:hypothetical protein